jgi:hypothetical protein
MRLSISLVLATAALLCASPLKTSKKKGPGSPTPLDTTRIKSAVDADTAFNVVKVGREQSASWLAYRHLGAWTPLISTRIKLDNPAIQDLNRLEVGQLLRLRRSLDQRQQTPARQIDQAMRKAVVTYARGSVQVVRQGTTQPVSLNEFLSPGDKLVTASNAVVELVIDNQSVLRLRENTVLSLVEIQNAAPTQTARTVVYLEAGRVWSKVRKWAGPLVGFQVKMPNAIAGVHGTTFECFVEGDSSGVVSVMEGTVGVMGRAQSMEQPVTAGRSVLVSRDGYVGEAPSQKPSPKDWKQFNEQRDQALEEMTSAYYDAAQTQRNAVSDAAARTSGQPDQLVRPEGIQ